MSARDCGVDGDQRIAHPRGSGGGQVEIVGKRLECHGTLPATQATQAIDEPTARDHLGGTRGLVARGPAPQIDEQFLHRMLRVARVWRPTPQRRPDQRPMLLDTLVHGELIASRNPWQQSALPEMTDVKAWAINDR